MKIDDCSFPIDQLPQGSLNIDEQTLFLCTTTLISNLLNCIAASVSFTCWHVILMYYYLAPALSCCPYISNHIIALNVVATMAQISQRESQDNDPNMGFIARGKRRTRKKNFSAYFMPQSERRQQLPRPFRMGCNLTYGYKLSTPIYVMPMPFSGFLLS